MSDFAEGDPTISAAYFTASPEGFAQLETNPGLLAAVARFSIGGINGRSEDVLNPHYVPGWQHVYTGALTETMTLDGVDVAASTFTTGRRRWDQGYPQTRVFRMPRLDLLRNTARSAEEAQALIQGLPTTREKRDPRVDLVQQSFYLRALGDLMGTSDEEELFVPDQWFAMEAPNGDSLAASRHVPGWMTLSQWLQTHRRPNQNPLGIEFDSEQIIKEAAGRVRAAVGNSALRHGLDGLLDGDGRYWGDTMIVPENICTPRDSQLGVVRLPSARRARANRKAMQAAAERVADQVTHHIPPLREPSPHL